MVAVQSELEMLRETVREQAVEIERLRRRTHEIQEGESKRNAELQSFRDYWRDIAARTRLWYDRQVADGVPAFFEGSPSSPGGVWIAKWSHISAFEAERAMALMAMVYDAESAVQDKERQ